MLLALLLLCCAEPPVDERAVYLEALSTAPDAAMLERCAGLTVPVRDECIAVVAERSADAGDAALAEEACAHIGPGAWRGECWFQTSDALEATGELARRLCAQAERYEVMCLSDAAGREAMAMLEWPIGEEAALREALETLMAAYFKPRKAAQKAERFYLGTLAHRWGGDARFDPALCGAAPTEDCAAAYASSLRAPPGSPRLAQMCAGPRTPEAIEALNGRGWTEAGEALALGVWETRCQTVVR